MESLPSTLTALLFNTFILLGLSFVALLTVKFVSMYLMKGFVPMLWR